MADIINLRLARKAARQRKAKVTAAENRALFGQSGTQRQARKAQAERAARALDGARREGEEP